MTEAGAAALQLSDTFKNNKDILDALHGSLLLSKGAHEDLSSAITTTSGVLTQFNLSATDSDRAANVFVAGAQHSKESAQQLGEAVEAVGPTAKNLGMSLEETTAVMMAFGDSNMKGAEAGSAFATSMKGLTKDNKSVTDSLSAMGLTFDQINPQMHSMDDIINTLAAHHITLAEAQTLFGRSGAALFSIVEDGTGKLGAYQSEITGTSAAVTAAKVAGDNYESTMKKFGVAVETAEIALGNVFIPALTSTLGVMTELTVESVLFCERLGEIPAKVAEAGQGASNWLYNATGGQLGYDEMKTLMPSASVQPAALDMGKMVGDTYADGVSQGIDAKTGEVADQVSETLGGTAALAASADAADKVAKEFTKAYGSQFEAGMTLINDKWVSNQDSAKGIVPTIGKTSIVGFDFVIDSNYDLMTPTGVEHFSGSADWASRGPSVMKAMLGRSMTALESAELSGDVAAQIKLKAAVKVDATFDLTPALKNMDTFAPQFEDKFKSLMGSVAANMTAYGKTEMKATGQAFIDALAGPIGISGWGKLETSFEALKGEMDKGTESIFEKADADKQVQLWKDKLVAGIADAGTFVKDSMGTIGKDATQAFSDGVISDSEKTMLLGLQPELDLLKQESPKEFKAAGGDSIQAMIDAIKAGDLPGAMAAIGKLAGEGFKENVLGGMSGVIPSIAQIFNDPSLRSQIKDPLRYYTGLEGPAIEQALDDINSKLKTGMYTADQADSEYISQMVKNWDLLPPAIQKYTKELLTINPATQQGMISIEQYTTLVKAYDASLAGATSTTQKATVGITTYDAACKQLESTHSATSGQLTTLDNQYKAGTVSVDQYKTKIIELANDSLPKAKASTDAYGSSVDRITQTSLPGFNSGLDTTNSKLIETGTNISPLAEISGKGIEVKFSPAMVVADNAKARLIEGTDYFVKGAQEVTANLSGILSTLPGLIAAAQARAANGNITDKTLTFNQPSSSSSAYSVPLASPSNASVMQAVPVVVTNTTGNPAIIKNPSVGTIPTGSDGSIDYARLESIYEISYKAAGESTTAAGKSTVAANAQTLAAIDSTNAAHEQTLASQSSITGTKSVFDDLSKFNSQFSGSSTQAIDGMDRVATATTQGATSLNQGYAAVRMGMTEDGRQIEVIGRVAQQQFEAAGGKWVTASGAGADAVRLAGEVSANFTTGASKTAAGDTTGASSQFKIDIAGTGAGLKTDGSIMGTGLKQDGVTTGQSITSAGTSFFSDIKGASQILSNVFATLPGMIAAAQARAAGGNITDKTLTFNQPSSSSSGSGSTITDKTLNFTPVPSGQMGSFFDSPVASTSAYSVPLVSSSSTSASQAVPVVVMNTASNPTTSKVISNPYDAITRTPNPWLDAYSTESLVNISAPTAQFASPAKGGSGFGYSETGQAPIDYLAAEQTPLLSVDQKALEAYYNSLNLSLQPTGDLASNVHDLYYAADTANPAVSKTNAQLDSTKSQLIDLGNGVYKLTNPIPDACVSSDYYNKSLSMQDTMFKQASLTFNDQLTPAQRAAYEGTANLATKMKDVGLCVTDTAGFSTNLMTALDKTDTSFVGSTADYERLGLGAKTSSVQVGAMGQNVTDLGGSSIKTGVQVETTGNGITILGDQSQATGVHVGALASSFGDLSVTMIAVASGAKYVSDAYKTMIDTVRQNVVSSGGFNSSSLSPISSKDLLAQTGDNHADYTDYSFPERKAVPGLSDASSAAFQLSADLVEASAETNTFCEAISPGGLIQEVITHPFIESYIGDTKYYAEFKAQQGLQTPAVNTLDPLAKTVQYGSALKADLKTGGDYITTAAKDAQVIGIQTANQQSQIDVTGSLKSSGLVETSLNSGASSLNQSAVNISASSANSANASNANLAAITGTYSQVNQQSLNTSAIQSNIGVQGATQQSNIGTQSATSINSQNEGSAGNINNGNQVSAGTINLSSTSTWAGIGANSTGTWADIGGKATSTYDAINAKNISAGDSLCNGLRGAADYLGSTIAASAGGSYTSGSGSSGGSYQFPTRANGTWGGTSINGGGSWISGSGVPGMNGGTYFGSTSPSGNVSWGGTAASNAAAGGGSGSAGSVQWATGGIINHPTFGLAGESGREAFVPLDDKAAGWAILSKILPEFGVQPFATGGIVGSGNAIRVQQTATHTQLDEMDAALNRGASALNMAAANVTTSSETWARTNTSIISTYTLMGQQQVATHSKLDEMDSASTKTINSQNMTTWNSIGNSQVDTWGRVGAQWSSLNNQVALQQAATHAKTDAMNGTTSAQSDIIIYDPETTRLRASIYGEQSTTAPSLAGTDMMMASGGIVDRATIGIFGEAGREALVPLDDKTAGWNILRQILPEFGIQPFAEGGIVGQAQASVNNFTINTTTRTDSNASDRETLIIVVDMSGKEIGRQIAKGNNKRLKLKMGKQ
jgi:TP901 family phage tail tape measure protein